MPMPLPSGYVLFISHNAGRSGAPVLLLEVIREFKRSSAMPFRILLVKGGALAAEFQSLGETMIWQPDEPPARKAFLPKLLSRLQHAGRLQMRKAVIRRRLKSTALIFSNTIANGHVLTALRFLNCPVIAYVHELEASIRELSRYADIPAAMERTSLFLAVSGAVKDNLVRNHGIAADRVKVVRTQLSVLSRDRNAYQEEVAQFRRKNGIPPTAVVVGLSGSTEWRKGFDLFFPLAKLYHQLFEAEVHFVWIGIKEHDGLHFRLLPELHKLQIAGTVHLVPHADEPMAVMAAFDIHLLLSREDPYPLVVLEAATLRIPTVCFAQAGGAAEFVGEDGGYCVPYGDLREAARSLNALAEDRQDRLQKGENARRKVGEWHHRPEAVNALIEFMSSHHVKR